MKLSHGWLRFVRSILHGCICWGLACLSFAASCYSCFGANAFCRKVLSSLVTNPEPFLKRPYAETDSVFEPLAKEGNIFLRFRGFDPDNNADASLMARIYFRASYIAYPVRVFVSRKEHIINQGVDVGRLNLEPGPELMRELDIAKVVVYRRVSADSVGFQIFDAFR